MTAPAAQPTRIEWTGGIQVHHPIRATKCEHYVTVTPGALHEDDWREEATVKFECRGDRTSQCHLYPDCDCEYWDDNHEHPRVPHDECWMQGWFDSECGAVYDGEDADDSCGTDTCVPRDMDRSGPIKASFELEYVSWEFKS